MLNPLSQKFIIAVLLLALITSCASSLKINKEIETSAGKVEIKTIVHKYVIRDSTYYGSITTTNNTLDTLLFNFNQKIIIEGNIIRADYNIYPVSWAPQAFYVLPKSISTWKVAWKSKTIITDPFKLTLIPDTGIYPLSEIENRVKTFEKIHPMMLLNPEMVIPD
jgi:hypothetical protein